MGDMTGLSNRRGKESARTWLLLGGLSLALLLGMALA
jgi:hypothetical protein